MVVGAEGAADLVVDLDHSKCSFGGVVGERNGRVGKYTEDLVLLRARPGVGQKERMVTKPSRPADRDS